MVLRMGGLSSGQVPDVTLPSFTLAHGFGIRIRLIINEPEIANSNTSG